MWRFLRFPLNAALTIVGAGDDDKDVQAALQDAYESGKLRGKQLIQARRVIESRQNLGRSVARGAPRKRQDVTTSSLVRVYQKEVDRQKQVVKKTEIAQQRLLFVIGALRELLTAIDEYVAHHNSKPKPFIWTASARDILQKVIRANSRLSSKQNGALH